MFVIFRAFRLKCNSKYLYRVSVPTRNSRNNYYTLRTNTELTKFQSKISLQQPCFNQVQIIRTMATGPSTSTETANNQKPPKKTNRLSLEKSPYLLQHATNPVDWFPWGEEAFELSRKENRLIFLSVGYSTCHWCHVMEKESFENDSVAEVLNKSFVSIKVDREERPDVDKLYMTYVQRTTGGGGWPMSVFLTPNLEPVFGGTYFPPEDKYGRVGFKSLLQLIAKQWAENHITLGVKAKSSVDAIRRLTTQSFATTEEISIPGPETLKRCTTQFLRSYDKTYGGFSDAPKFPQPSNFNYLFHVHSLDRKSEEGKAIFDSCIHTLKRMAYGGIHDHVNCGFARYSVDERWHVPHFEKMLYDQAQLAVSYTEAYLVSKDVFFKEVTDDILTYVSRDLSHDLGGFYGAEDADSYPYKEADHKQEGAFCVWEYDELSTLIKGRTDKFSYFDLFVYHFDVKKNGNVPPQYDPHNELKNKNILGCSRSLDATATAFKISLPEVKKILTECYDILYEERQNRPKPHVDTKIVTAWNGLMISGYARAGFAFNEDAYTERAVLAVNFIRRYLYDEEAKILLRCCYRGGSGEVSQISAPISGFVQDYAFLIRGLVDVYEATLDVKWLEWAETLQETQDKLFWDETNFAYFTSPEGDPNIVMRDKEDQDGAEPCGNSVTVHNLLRLAAYLNKPDFKDRAEKTLKAFSERLRQVAIALPEMASALMHFRDGLPQIFIAGALEDEKTQQLLQVVRDTHMPGKLLIVTDGKDDRSDFFQQRQELMATMKPMKGQPTVYVCRNFTCSLPVTKADELRAMLETESQRKN